MAFIQSPKMTSLEKHKSVFYIQESLYKYILSGEHNYEIGPTQTACTSGTDVELSSHISDQQ